jgi:hypothetical protein
LTTLLARVPEDMQGVALLSGIAKASQRNSAQGGFSFTNFTKLYRGLRENAPIYAKIAKAVGPEGERVLTDLYAVSRRMADGEAKILHTGKSNQALVAAMTGENIVRGVMKATAHRAAVGVGAAAGGTVAGAPGAAAGAMTGEAVVNGVTRSGKTSLDKAHGLLASAEFRNLVEKVSTGTQTAADTNRLLASKGFNTFARHVGLATPESRRAWLTNLLAATGDVAAVPNPEVKPASPVEVQ